MARGRAAILALVTLLVLAGPALAPYDPGHGFDRYPYAPPMRPHVVDDRGAWHAPFAYPVAVTDLLERTYAEDRSRRITFASPEPWFLLGSDGFGRDVLSRLLAGARLSLGVAALAAVVALLAGALAGATAAYAGGWPDALLMRVADLVLVLPVMYLALVLRGALPLVLTNAQVFGVLVGVLALAGWPSVARGVRGIIAAEGRSEYAEAARALGASSTRVIARHLLPATRGFLGVQATLLVPSFIMAEATLSFVGFGFAPPSPSWGVMLRDAAQVQIAVDAPWLLAPAVAVSLTVFVIQSTGAAPDRGAHTIDRY